MRPKPFNKLTFNDVIFGKVYDEWSENPVSYGDVMYKEVSVTANGATTNVLKAFTCATSVWQTYQCTQKVPGAAGSELIWVEVPIDSKILVN